MPDFMQSYKIAEIRLPDMIRLPEKIWFAKIEKITLFAKIAQ